MILNCYSIKDKLTEFNGVICIKDDKIAERIFKGYCEREKAINYTESRYFELYKVGTFNTDTGELTGLAKQEIKLIKEGEQYEQSD